MHDSNFQTLTASANRRASSTSLDAARIARDLVRAYGADHGKIGEFLDAVQHACKAEARRDTAAAARKAGL